MSTNIPVESYTLGSIYAGNNSITLTYKGYLVHVRLGRGRSGQRWEAYVHNPSWEVFFRFPVSVHDTLQEAFQSAYRWADWITNNSLMKRVLTEACDRGVISPNECKQLAYSIALQTLPWQA